MNAPNARRRPRSGQSNRKPIPGLPARSRAAELVCGVLSEGKALDGAFETQRQNGDLQVADRALTQALVLTTLRRLPTIDAAIDACLDKPLHPSASRASAILRVMAAQLLVLDMADHAAVTLAVEDAARNKETRKLKGLINAVGRRMVREKQRLKETAPASDLPSWLSDRWARTYGAATTDQIAATLRHQPDIDLSLKPGEAIDTWLARFSDFAPLALDGSSIRLTKPGRIEDLPGYAEGLWWVQDYAASLPAKMLLSALPPAGERRVLDLCAAPGGKTAQLASAGCEVTAVDQSQARMSRLKANMERLSLSVDMQVDDALAYSSRGGAFDAVLLDAPCSATGTLRRNPDIGYVRSEQDVIALAKVQAELIKASAALAKPGGLLVFATCSLEPEEGDAQITRFMRSHENWSLVAMPAGLAPDKAVQEDGTLRTLPHLPAGTGASRPGMDGFFAACLRAPN